MGQRTVITIYPECIRPHAPLPTPPVLRDALKFNSNDLAHALFFAGRQIARASLRAPRYLWWPLGIRRAIYRLHPTANPAFSKYLQHDLKSRLDSLRARVEPRQAQGSKGNDLTLTAYGQSLTDTARGRLSEDLGLAMTGLYCYETLNVVQLLGSSLAENYFLIRLRDHRPGKATKQRPDFIGFDVRYNAIIAEAKGRRENLRLPALAAVVDDQLKSVREVRIRNSLHDVYETCRLYHRIGCIASFETSSSPLKLHVLDDRCWRAPVPAGHEDGEPLEANLRSTLVYLYYLLLCAAVGDDQITLRDSGSGAGPYRIVELPGITFGVLDSIYRLIVRNVGVDPGDPSFLLGFALEIDNILESLDLGDQGSRDEDSRDQGMFRDGTLFQAEWTFESEHAEAT